MRKFVPVLVVILLAGSGAALDFTLRDSCGTDETALFSMSNTTNAHAAGPGHYADFTGSYGQDGKVVCASEDVEGVNIAQSCNQRLRNPVLSFYDPDSGQTHLAPDEERYDYVLCAANLATSVRRTCSGNSEPIVSIYSPEEQHIARPGHYPWQVCGALFQNATVAYEFTMGGNTQFITNGNIGTFEGGNTSTDEPGYAAVTKGERITGIVGGGGLPQMVRSGSQGNRAKLNITLFTAADLQWFLPFTIGTRFDIEQRFRLIRENNFMSQFNPNFAFELAEDILVKLSLHYENIDLVNRLSLAPGFYQLTYTNTGVNQQTGEKQVSINASIS
ncbi:MAG: hypothetical protein SV186_04450 [Candidatus Nanohaloarchaea archaeon]|nr:hypothetical protein [Candidatus Nanohaloarchaea archaeon]